MSGLTHAIQQIVNYVSESEFYQHVVAVMPALWHGALIAVLVVVMAETIGITLGLVLALMRLSKRWFLIAPAMVYVDIIRGTPMLVQILFLYFGIPALYDNLTGETLNLGLWIDKYLPFLTTLTDKIVGTDPNDPFTWEAWYNEYSPFVAGVLALGLNSGAYVSEIFRTAISSIDRGQTEAARALGLGRRQTFRYIVFPQAFRWAIPPLGNEFITLLKDTSLLSVVGVIEILKAGQLYASRTYQVFPAYFAIAIVYIILTVPVSIALRLLERKLKVPA